jgi:aminopeptidase
MQDLIQVASKNISDILKICIEFEGASTSKALVVYDTQNGLTKILTEAYRNVLPKAKFIDFDTLDKENILAEFELLQARDLVVLIQSSSFRLDDFRIRLHLFSKKVKVVEHLHLYRNDPAVWDVYVNSLAYDKSWYRQIGPSLKQKLDQCQRLEIVNGDSKLVFENGLEAAKLNIGDYTKLENIGGTFPIGEVFTETKDFSCVNGSFILDTFANKDFSITFCEPFEVRVENSLIVGYSRNASEEFKEMIEKIQSVERPLLREIGFGLNRAITKQRYLGDITAFERQIGVHFSIGEKHSVYKKPGIQAYKSRFHVDVFPVVDCVLADGVRIFEKGEYYV